jgi:hypothetical protein
MEDGAKLGDNAYARPLKKTYLIRYVAHLLCQYHSYMVLSTSFEMVFGTSIVSRIDEFYINMIWLG